MVLSVNYYGLAISSFYLRVCQHEPKATLFRAREASRAAFSWRDIYRGPRGSIK